MTAKLPWDESVAVVLDKVVVVKALRHVDVSIGIRHQLLQGWSWSITLDSIDALANLVVQRSLTRRPRSAQIWFGEVTEVAALLVAWFFQASDNAAVLGRPDIAKPIELHPWIALNRNRPQGLRNNIAAVQELREACVVSLVRLPRDCWVEIKLWIVLLYLFVPIDADLNLVVGDSVVEDRSSGERHRLPELPLHVGGDVLS